MLACSCNWKGINLVPNFEDDTARCPECSTVFKGIPAKDAIVVSSAENDKITLQAEAELAMLLVAQAFLKHQKEG